MSSDYAKIEYHEEGHYGETIKKTLYVHFNNSCDVESYYDEHGNLIFQNYDCVKDNLVNAINNVHTGNYGISKDEFNKIFKSVDNQ